MNRHDLLQDVRRHDPVFRSPSLLHAKRGSARAAWKKIAVYFVVAIVVALPAFSGARFALEHPEEVRGWINQGSASVQGKIQVIVGRSFS